jgi:hypothetical protein
MIASIFTVKTFDHFRSRVSPKRRSIVAFRTGERSRPVGIRLGRNLLRRTKSKIVFCPTRVVLCTQTIREGGNEEVRQNWDTTKGKNGNTYEKRNQKADRERQEKDGDEESRNRSSISCCSFERTGGGG